MYLQLAALLVAMLLTVINTHGMAARKRPESFGFVRVPLPPTTLAFAYAVKHATVHLEKRLVCG